MRYNPKLGMATVEATDRRRDRWVSLRVEEILEMYSARACCRADALYTMNDIGIPFERACELLDGSERR